MARRSYQRAKQGQLYAVEWPEWFVDCTQNNCKENGYVAGTGEANNEKDALDCLKKNVTGEMEGWTCCKGLWYCPKHNRKEK